VELPDAPAPAGEAPAPLARDAASSQAWGVQRPLFLTGMMGCGKTTVGRVLAHSQGVPLIDLDARLERMLGASVAELLAERGEPGFREAEAQALASLLAEPGFCGHGVVVATGGGAVLHPGSREAMDRVGTRIYLEVGVDELVRRLRPEVEADAQARPLLAGGPPGGALVPGGEPVGLAQRVAELLAARRSSYRAGAVCIDAHGEPAAVAARIVTAMQGSVGSPGGPAGLRGAPGHAAAEAGPPSGGALALGSEAV
jgi:shikimate kinase